MKRWGLFTETAFKDTFIDQVEAGVAARALLNVTWLLCKDGGKYGQTQIFKELQSLYSDALSCHGSFQNADKSLIREACGKLAEEMQYAVPPSLYGKYANERPNIAKFPWPGPSIFTDLFPSTRSPCSRIKMAIFRIIVSW